MRTIKLLHTSDIHIDWPFEMFGEAARLQRRRDLFAAFEYICELAVSEEVDGLLIAGDLFNSGVVDRHTVSLVVSGFMKLAEHHIRVIILPGNHDMAIRNLLSKNNGLAGNVFVFSGDTWQEYHGLKGVTLYGLPYTNRHKSIRVFAEPPVLTGSTYHIGMVHGSVSGLPHIEGDYYPMTTEDIGNSGFHYLALGHYHNFRDCSAGNTICYYPGSPERLTYNNLSERKAVIIRMEDGRVTAEPVPVPSRAYIVVDFDINREGLAHLYMRLNQWSDASAFVRLNVRGLVNQDNLFAAEQIEQQFRHKFFDLEICDLTRVMPEADPMDKTVRGVFVRKIQARLASEGLTEEDRTVLTEALKVGLTALEGGKL